MRPPSLHVTSGARYVEAAQLSWCGETPGAGAAVAAGRKGSRVRVRPAESVAVAEARPWLVSRVRCEFQL